MTDYYELLGVPPDADFPALKKAYYRLAKQCHPDHFANSPEKTEEFKRLVAAFNTLSDPDLRMAYDEKIQRRSDEPSSVNQSSFTPHQWVMDTEADDALEELVVGNSLDPGRTNILTMFLDMQRTEIFIAWRSAEYLYRQTQYGAACRAFRELVRRVPDNILYQVYYARSLAHCGRVFSSLFHYRAAFAIGAKRTPPQELHHLRNEVHGYWKKRSFLLRGLTVFFVPPETPVLISAEEEMIASMNRLERKRLREERRKKQQLLSE